MPVNASKAHDVWGLAMTLVAMVTGCAPWDAALPSDPRFCAFWSEDACTKAPWCALSDPLLHLLRRMLAPSESRCTIADVKACVSIPLLRMDAFSAPQPSYVHVPPKVAMTMQPAQLIMS